MMDGITDGRTAGQLKSNIAPLFQRGAIKSGGMRTKKHNTDLGYWELHPVAENVVVARPLVAPSLGSLLTLAPDHPVGLLVRVPKVGVLLLGDSALVVSAKQKWYVVIL